MPAKIVSVELLLTFIRPFYWFCLVRKSFGFDQREEIFLFHS